MSEENKIELEIITDTESAEDSAQERLAAVDLSVLGRARSLERASSAVKSENDKKFNSLRAAMAENTRLAEKKGAERAEELKKSLESEQSSINAPEQTPSEESSCKEATEPQCDAPVTEEPAVAEAEKDENEELVIKIGDKPAVEKYILSVNPQPNYFPAYPYYPPYPQTQAPHPRQHQPAPYQQPQYQPQYQPPQYQQPQYQPPVAYPESKSESPANETSVYSAPMPIVSDPEPSFPDPIEEKIARGEDKIFYEEVPIYSEQYADYPDPVAEKIEPKEEKAEAERVAKTDYIREDTSSADEYHMMREQSELYDPRSEELDLFSRAQLAKTVNVFRKEEVAILRKIQKIDARQEDADSEQSVALAVEKIGLQKELCELSVEVLGACVYASAKGKTSRYQRVLRTHIDKYNIYCEEYEKITGRPLSRVGYGIIDDVLAGRITQPIPNVYYYGAEGDAVYNASDLENDRLQREEAEYAALSREYERYEADGGAFELTPTEKSREEKKKAARLSSIRRATERDILLVALRNEYRIDSLEAKRDILVNSYGSDRGAVKRELRSIEKTMSRARAAARRSIPLEREDNTRYYLLAALDPENEKVKDGARRDRLASLRQRLEVLLSERESINERLIVLYGGSDKKLKKAKVNRKAASVRRKSAKRAFKKQSDLARRIERFNVSADMKERAYALLNRKTEAVAKAEEARYKIRHLNLRGRARSELFAEFNRAKKEAKRTDSEIKYMLRRLKKIQDRHADRKDLAILFTLVGVFVVAIGAAWFAFGSDIVSYFKELFSKLRGL